jgi:hypothetical protein
MNPAHTLMKLLAGSGIEGCPQTDRYDVGTAPSQGFLLMIASFLSYSGIEFTTTIGHVADAFA